MIIGVLKEPTFETRVSLLAESVAALTKKNIEVWVETGAGDNAVCSLADYEKAGAKVVPAPASWRRQTSS
jgi:H+-translocating NAD(P) transhydrogenase subunit alpha